MSDTANWVMVGIGAAGLLGSGAVAMVGVGKHGQRIADLEAARAEDLKRGQREADEIRARVAAAESAAGAVKGLAQAIESMGEKFSSEVKHLVEKFGLETGHIREQLTDLKEEVRLRAPARRHSAEG